MFKLKKIQIFSKEIAGLILSIYLATQIIFSLTIYIDISNKINILVWVYYILFFIFNQKKTLKTNYYINIFAVFTVFSLASTLWSIDFSLSYNTSITLFLNLLNLFILYNFIKDFKIKDYILYGIILASFFNYAIAFNIINFFNPYENGLQFIGTMARSGGMAVIMIFSMFASIVLLDKANNKILKSVIALNLLLSIYIIFLTVSKKGIIIGLFMIIFFILTTFKNIRKLFLITIFTFLFIGIFSKFIDSSLINEKLDRTASRFLELQNTFENGEQGGSTGDRLYFIEVGINALQNNPLFGTGLATFAKHNKMGYYSHNNYIELLVAVGLIGTVIYYLIYIYSFKKLLNINYMPNKSIFYIFLSALLIMDNALVSYNLRIVLLVILYISLTIEEFQNEKKLNYND